MFQEKNSLPEDWEIKKLGKVLSLVYGKGLPRRDRKAGEIPVYGSNGVIGYHNKPLIKQDTTVVGRKGSVGAINFVLGPSWPIDTTYYVKIKDGSLLKFIYYLLRSINLAHLDQSTAIPGINRNAIYNLNVMIPSIEIQQKVVARLDAFFEHYNELKKEKQKAKEKYEQIIQSAIASFIAKGEWQKSKLGEICVINPPKKEVNDFSDDLEVSFVPMSFVDDREGAIKKQEIKKFAEVRRGYTYFTENDVLFAKITPCMENGKAAIAKNLKNGIGFGSTEFHVIRPNENILSDFIFYYIRQPFFRGEAASKMSGTAGQLRVPKRFLEDYEIPLPPIEEQKKIVKLLEKIKLNSSSIYEEQKNIDYQLEQLPKSVLSKAFKGELVS